MVFIKKLQNTLRRGSRDDAVQLVKNKSSSLFIKIVAYFLLFDVAFVFLYPFFHMLVTSVMNISDLNNIAIKWVPSTLYFDNYRSAFTQLDYIRSLLNSTLVAATTTVGHIVSCSMVAYALSRYRYPGRNLMFVLVLLTIIVPIQTIIVPQYIVYVNLGIVEGVLPLIIPTFFGFGLKGGLFVFIFRQFFMNLPKELEEASLIDGCGPAKTYIRIIMPVSRTAVLVVGVLSLVWHWNDYFEPSLYIRDQSQYLLPMRLPGIYELMQQAEQSAELMLSKSQYTEGVVMAATILVILPIFLVYIFLQRKFMQGIESTGIVG